jgi:hypothetical protein
VSGLNRIGCPLSAELHSKAITVKVTGSKAGYITVSKTSKPTAEVAG